MEPISRLARVVAIFLILVSIAIPAAAQSRPTTPPVQAPAELTKELRPSLLKQAQTIADQRARAAVSATAAPPRRRGLANWQKQVLFWGGIVGGLILWGVLESEWD